MSRRDLDPLPFDIAELLAAERRAPPPPAARKSRILSRVEAAVGIGVAAGVVAAGGAAAEASGTTTATASAAGASGMGAGAVAAKTAMFALPLSKALVAAATVAAVGFGAGSVAYLARSSHDRPPGRGGSAVSPAVSSRTMTVAMRPEVVPEVPAPVIPAATEAPPAPVAPVAATAPAAASSRTLGAAPTADVDADTDLGAESALLEHARIALAHGHPAIALADVATHAGRFSHGTLIEEREALWVKALVRIGDRDAARTRAAAFRRHFPHSIQREAIARALHQAP